MDEGNFHEKNKNVDQNVNVSQDETKRQGQDRDQDKTASQNYDIHNLSKIEKRIKDVFMNVGKIQRIKSTKTIFIRGLPKYTTSYDLYILCSPFGNIHLVRFICQNTQAFVRFYKCKDANAAILGLNQLLIYSNYILTVDFAFRCRRRLDKHFRAPTNLYFENLPTSWSVKDIENVCKPYGRVIAKRILSRSNGQLYNYGFVRFQTHEQAYNAILFLNGYVLERSNNIKLKVCFANRHNEKSGIRNEKESNSSSEEEEEEKKMTTNSQNDQETQKNYNSNSFDNKNHTESISYLTPFPFDQKINNTGYHLLNENYFHDSQLIQTNYDENYPASNPTYFSSSNPISCQTSQELPRTTDQVYILNNVGSGVYNSLVFFFRNEIYPYDNQLYSANLTSIDSNLLCSFPVFYYYD